MKKIKSFSSRRQIKQPFTEVGQAMERASIQRHTVGIDVAIENYPLKQLLEASKGRAIDRAIVVAYEDRATRAALMHIRHLVQTAECTRDRSRIRPMFRETLPTLARALAFRNGDWSVRQAVVQALGVIWGDGEVVPTLEYILKNDRALTVRVAAAEELANIGGEEAIVVLTNALGTKDVDVRRIAITCLESRTNRRFAIPALQNALGHADPLVRRGATTVMDHLEWKSTSETMEAWYLVAKQQWDDVDQHGQLALGPLENAIKGLGAAVRLKAAETLNRLEWDAENYAMLGWFTVALQDWPGASRLKMSATVALVNALEGDEAEVRKSAANVLLKLGLDSVLALAAVLRESRDPQVLQAAASILGTIARAAPQKGEPHVSNLFIEAVPALLHAIQDTHGKVILEPGHTLADIAQFVFLPVQIPSIFGDVVDALQIIAREQHTVIRQDLDSVRLRILHAADVVEEQSGEESLFVTLFRKIQNRK